MDVLCSGFREEMNKLLPGEDYIEAFYRLRNLLENILCCILNSEGWLK